MTRFMMIAIAGVAVALFAARGIADDDDYTEDYYAASDDDFANDYADPAYDESDTWLTDFIKDVVPDFDRDYEEAGGDPEGGFDDADYEPSAR